MDFRGASTEEHMLEQYVVLMKQSFPDATKFNSSYLNWLYKNNPDGEVIGYDAFDGDLLVAHYVCIPTTINLLGKTVKALLSLNTATHPAYQGRGLFTTLAEKAYQLGADNGFVCAYGVANANSTPGFVRKLNFQLVQPLEARIGIGPLNISTSPLIAQFQREWTRESLSWRCTNPANAVVWQRTDNRLRFYAKSRKLISAYAEINSDISLPCVSNSEILRFYPLRLFIGLVAGDASALSKYCSIPERLKPSPLNFIFRPFSRDIKILDRGMVNFSFLDFDAY